MYDLIIKSGKIIDGTGSPSFLADIGIKDGKIVRIARWIEVTGDGAKVIDAKGLVVTPGFIDSHSHSDSSVLTLPDQKEKIEQGITTSIGGMCGFSQAPYATEVKETVLGSNIAVFAGHNTIRRSVMGMENRKPTESELEQMKELVRKNMESGALGLSFGLTYTPSGYADTEELIELAKVVGEYHGLVSAHIRNEGDHLIQATEEFIKVIRESGTRGIHSHHKAMWKENWGKVSHTLRMLEQANEEGVEIYCDAYPYTASHTSMGARFVPKEYHAFGLTKVLSDPEKRREIIEWNLQTFGEDLSWVLVASCSTYPEYEGLRIPEIARLRGQNGYEAVLDIIRDCNGAQACYFCVCEEDMEAVLAYPRSMICTDSDVAGQKTTYHPRLRASFPRVLGRYVRERRVTSLPEMIRKMTSMPATVYGLRGKGLIKEGFDADICIFDADKIIDRAEYADCTRKAEGLNYVLLNGQIVVEDAVYLGIRAGKVIDRDA